MLYHLMHAAQDLRTKVKGRLVGRLFMFICSGWSRIQKSFRAVKRECLFASASRMVKRRKNAQPISVDTSPFFIASASFRSKQAKRWLRAPFSPPR